MSEYNNYYSRQSSRNSNYNNNQYEYQPPPSSNNNNNNNNNYMSRPPSMQYYSNQQQQNRPLETPLSQYTSTPTPNAPIKQYTQKQHPGRSIIGANGIQDHNLYKEATRRMTNAQVRKGHMFSTSGIEPDIQLNYSPRTVNNLVNLHHHRQNKLDQRLHTANNYNNNNTNQPAMTPIKAYTKPIIIDQSPRRYERGNSRHVINGGATSFRNPIVDRSPAPTSTIAQRKYIDRVNGRFNPKKNFKLAIERPMARKNYKREYNVQWSNDDFSQDTTHLVSPRTFASPYRSVGERIMNARNVLVENMNNRMSSSSAINNGRTTSKENQIRLPTNSNKNKTISKPLLTKDFNTRFHDESKPPYNMYMYKQPRLPPAEYPYDKNKFKNNSKYDVNSNAAAGVPTIVAKISEKTKGRVRDIKRPEFMRTSLISPSRQASPHRVFTYKKQVTLDNTARGPLSSY